MIMLSVCLFWLLNLQRNKDESEAKTFVVYVLHCKYFCHIRTTKHGRLADYRELCF